MDTQETKPWSMDGDLLVSFDQLKAVKEKSGRPVGSSDIDTDKFEENPYGYIHDLYTKWEKMAPSLPVNLWETQVLDALHLKYLKRRVDKNADKKIPSLNDIDTVKVKNSQVVQFRCMIQDHLGVEYSAPEHKVTNPITGEATNGSTLLQDSMELNDQDFIRTLNEKEIFVAISPPGENFWTSQETSMKSGAAMETKRTKLDGSEESGDFISLPNYKDVVPFLFSVAGETKPMACILKMYRSDEYSWKHNDLLEVTGLIQFPSQDKEEQGTDSSDEMLYPEFCGLPVLHVFSSVKLADGNPNILWIDEKMFPMFPISDIPILECAQTLRDLLSLGLGGDRFAAVYTMITLVSRVLFTENQAMTDPIGKIVLNIKGIHEKSDIPDLFTYIIKSLVPRTVNLDFGIESVNSMKLIPTKNMNTNLLEPGLLQLPVGTHLIINETGLQEGKFNDAGVRNLVALKELLLDQKVKYDYTYQYPQIEANFPTIILSKSPSVLPFNVQIDINAEENLTLEDRRSRVENILKEKGEMLRNYLTMLRSTRLSMRLYDYTDKTLMNDIVEYLGQRNSSGLFKTKMSADEYSAFITSCRSWCLMHGDGHITREGFMFWKDLERIRDSRLPR